MALRGVWLRRRRRRPLLVPLPLVRVLLVLVLVPRLVPLPPQLQVMEGMVTIR